MPILTSPEAIEIFRLKTIIKAIELESLGMKRRGRSVCACAKQEFNIKGNRATIIIKLTEIMHKKQGLIKQTKLDINLK